MGHLRRVQGTPGQELTGLSGALLDAAIGLAVAVVVWRRRDRVPFLPSG